MAEKSYRLIYVHDPMCSWCWGFRPTLRQLRELLPTQLTFTTLLGGLAEDSDQPMPAEMQRSLQTTWRTIQHRIPGTRFNFDFWRDCRPRRSTWPACRAVIAARTLDREAESPMIEAIQHAYYLQSKNPSDNATLVALAESIGLHTTQFAKLLNAGETQQALNAEMQQARTLGATSFPSLRLQEGDTTWPIATDYNDAHTMLKRILSLKSRETTPP